MLSFHFKMFKNWLNRQLQHHREERLALTRAIAKRLSQNRLVRGKPGDSAADLEQAEKIVRRPLQRTLFQVGFFWRGRVEAFENTWVEAALEGLVHDLSNLAIVDLLSVLASLSLISGGIGYFLDADERRDQNYYRAWSAINSARGQKADSGRKRAIEDLWKGGEDLTGLDIKSVEINNLDLGYRCSFGVGLPKFLCHLPWFGHLRTGVDLREANLEETVLLFVNLEKALLAFADLKGAHLENANLKGADLFLTDLEEAHLGNANLEGANLSFVNLKKSALDKVNSKKVNLEFADLNNSLLLSVNLGGANLSDTNLEKTLVLKSDLSNAENLTEAQLDDSLVCRTSLPSNLSIDSNRDCGKVGEWLKGSKYIQKLMTESTPESIDRYIEDFIKIEVYGIDVYGIGEE